MRIRKTGNFFARYFFRELRKRAGEKVTKKPDWAKSYFLAYLLITFIVDFFKSSCVYLRPSFCSVRTNS